MAKKQNYEWVTLQYEGASFDVCISTFVEEVDEIMASDSEINICSVMCNQVIEWMCIQALAEIHARENTPQFQDMSRREREVDAPSIDQDWGISK